MSRDGIERTRLGLEIAPALVSRLEAVAARRGVGLSEVAEDAIAAGIAAGLVDDALADLHGHAVSARAGVATKVG